MSTEYQEADRDERAEMVISTLRGLKDVGLIQDYSEDAGGNVIEYIDSDGIQGGVQIMEFDEDLN